MKIQISLSAEPEVETTIVLRGSNECVDRVLAFLGMLQYNGAVGHSGIFGLGWDGDGSAKLNCKELEPVIRQYKDGYAAGSSYGGDLEYMGDLGSFLCVRFAKDKFGHVEQKLVYSKGENQK